MAFRPAPSRHRALALALATAAPAGAGACADDAGCAVQFVVDAAPCDVDDCVLDFGTVAPGLSETLRLSWSGACNEDALLEDPSVADDTGVFHIGSSNLFLGDRADQGFVFVSATPGDPQPVRGSLDLPPYSFPLIVNDG